MLNDITGILSYWIYLKQIYVQGAQDLRACLQVQRQVKGAAALVSSRW